MADKTLDETLHTLELAEMEQILVLVQNIKHRSDVLIDIRAYVRSFNDEERLQVQNRVNELLAQRDSGTNGTRHFDSD